MGILSIRPTSEWTLANPWSPVTYIAMSLSLNILLTLMIVVRLVLHSRSIRASTGTSAGTVGLYKSIVTMLIESSALFAMGSLLFFILWAINNPVWNVSKCVLSETQVRASP